MTENRGIMSSFSPTLYLVKLADSFRTPIHGIGTAAITLTLYHLCSIYLVFLVIYYHKIIKVLNCIVTFFSYALCILEAWTGKTIGTRRERNRLYKLELTSD